MNLNLINLDPPQWSRTDWQDAYAQYCEKNMFGKMDKKCYYNFVMDNYEKRRLRETPLDPELAAKWRAGKWAARAWAKSRGCDMNGRLLKDIVPPRESINDLADRVDAMESAHENLKTAYVAHVTKINRNLPNMK